MGPTSEEAARRFFVNVAFLSTKGFLPAEGTFESSMATFRIKQIIAEQAARVVLLVDHSKFGQRALCKVLDIGQIDEVITDAGTAAADLAIVEQHGVAVRVAASEQLTREAPNPCFMKSTLSRIVSRPPYARQWFSRLWRADFSCFKSQEPAGRRGGQPQ